MKTFLTVLVLTASSLVYANKGLNAVNVVLVKRLSAALHKQYGPSPEAMKASQVLAEDHLSFETTESQSDFKILLNDDEMPVARKVSLSASKRETNPHEVDKLAILKEQLITNELSALRMKNGTVKFFANKSVLNSDLNSLSCQGRECFGAAFAFAYSVRSPRDRKSAYDVSISREAGSGMATGKAAKIITDRDTGRSKSKTVSLTDDELIWTWVDLFIGEPEQQIVVEYEKFNSRLISDFQNAKTLKLIVPVAMDKGISLMELGFAIKENGIKIALVGDHAEVTMTVINKSKSNVKNN